MSISSSLLQALLQDFPALRPQIYFKSALTALSQAIEDFVLVGKYPALVIANFQQERFYRQAVRRYQQIAQCTDQVYVLAVPEIISGLTAISQAYEIVTLASSDALMQEWHLIVVGEQYAACLVCREQITPVPAPMDQVQRFEGIWTFDRRVCLKAASLLLERMTAERSDLAVKVEQAWQRYGLTTVIPNRASHLNSPAIDSGIFAQRLMTYLQASQYKLLKAYRAIAAQERKERLINAITAAMRRSLNPEDILAMAVRELGQTFDHCRCLLYRLSPTEGQVKIEYESVASGLPALRGEIWPVADNPLIQVALAQEQAIELPDVNSASNLKANPSFYTLVQRYSIRSWLVVPIRYQGNLLGILELHYGGSEPYFWSADDISLVEAIATQAGVALTQAQAYTDLEALNNQLKGLERTQSNLIAIVGHELRTPLSTIRVCLESLANEPDMLPQLGKVMLETALTDAERLRQLLQDFLTLSQLESGEVTWQLDAIQLQECLGLALSSFKARNPPETLPQIDIQLPDKSPLVLADAEKLVEVLTKLLDNACKFTGANGKVTIQAKTLKSEPSNSSEGELNQKPMLEIIIADTGRGIEPTQLEAIFDRFYQEEGALRRTAGGTGLGLAICRRIIEGLGGKIWASSLGKNQGSQFHFTVPMEASDINRPTYEGKEVVTTPSNFNKL